MSGPDTFLVVVGCGVGVGLLAWVWDWLKGGKDD